jgi:putative membrane protein
LNQELKGVKTPRDGLLLAGKGMLMGAADVVPGVSGGTLAFITGIYEELIESLRRFDLTALQLLLQLQFKQCWQHVNATFLLVLVSGILVSLFSLARGVLYMLEHYPVLLWAFFFGLIVASVWSLIRHVKGWNFSSNLVFFLGAVAAWFITSTVPGALEVNPYTVFGSGMLAICAMILPGISGSFILLLLGMYTPILTALKEFDLALIGLFLAGCVLGLMAFSRVLSWAFHHHHRLILALLGGFLLGSLNKVWPWKYTLAYTIDHHGDAVPLVQRNLLPDTFTELTGQPAMLGISLALMAVGILLVLMLDRSNR